MASDNAKSSAARLSQIKGHLSSPSDSRDDPKQHQDDPTVILIFGWTAAPVSALQRYEKQYKVLFPNATVLLFPVTYTDLLLPLPHQATRSSHRGLVELLAATEDGSSSRILVHVFSGGGAARFGTVASLYRQKRGQALPARVLICDSAPTDAGSVSRARTLNDSIMFTNSPRFVKEVTRPFVTAGLGAAYLWTTATLQEEPTRKGRESLLDPKLMPASAVRGYVYSEMDQIVTSDEVERHIERARDLGLDVLVEKYTDSVHVGHAKKDSQRYWSFVERAWKQSCER